MLATMFQAKVGDDVFGEDPTVNELEALSRDIFGMEAALFCPSGTMTNQIAIKCHTEPGDEVICEKQSHVYIYEGGGIAFNSGCQVKSIHGDRGLINAQQVQESINPDDVHKPKSSLVSLENTANRGGGSCYDMADLHSIREVCLKNNLKLHLDGARLFNALVYKHQDPKEYGRIFDTISICLSKGLGAPVGSVLLGNAAFIKKSRRVRKVFGGGMRQAGYLAAAGIYALEHNVDRLQDDHKHAKMLAEAILKRDFCGKMLPVETNIVIFELVQRYTAMEFCARLKQENILCLPISPTQVRLVTHLDVHPQMIRNLISLIEVM
ncbi:MAG: threonine aldolase [Ferruginibacter sp.]|nr:threonine aldolase [Ferruginibacter sp.]